jgi:Fe-S cluster assembly iron-binding protein IscA
MIITPKAKEYILNNSEQTPATVRVSSSGMGCGGPDIYVTLEESANQDDIVVVEGIQISLEPGILPYVEVDMIDLVEAGEDKRLTIIDPDLAC